MITEVHIQGFKRLRDVKVQLGRLRVVVGNNGVGKSSLLQAVEGLVGAFAADAQGKVPDLSGWFSGAMAPRAVVSRPNPTAYDLAASRHDGALVRVRCPAPDVGATSAVAQWWFRRTGVVSEPEEGAPISVHDHGAVSMVTDPNRPTDWPRPLPLRLHAAAIAAPSWSMEEAPRMSPDGNGLASALQYLAGSRDERLAAIEAHVAQVVPEVRRLRALPAAVSVVENVRVSVEDRDTNLEHVRSVSGARFEADIAGVGWTRAEHLSEGTLLVLALVTQLHYHRPGLLLLDDLDRSLHPTAQVALVGVLRTLLDQHPELQILASTHSPYLVDELTGDEVLVAGETAPGVTQIRPLTDHPDWSAHRDVLRTGELWSAVAERWVGASA